MMGDEATITAVCVVCRKTHMMGAVARKMSYVKDSLTGLFV
jgi:hypothetical protein